MRPVNKGEAPDKVYKKYQEAEPDLEERLGPYCSYCELNIQNAPEVEHKEAKSAGGAELEWDNLLLSCKYCNTRKGSIVKGGDKEKYLWPDEDDTFHVFSYRGDVPEINEAYLKTVEKKTGDKARNLYGLLKLDHIPISPKEKDRRYMARSEARNSAVQSKSLWDSLKKTSYKRDFLNQTLILAQSTGFFSVWMEVFSEDEEVRDGLIKVFRGTRKNIV